MTPRRIDTAGLELGAGLEILLSASLEGTGPGGALDVESSSRQVMLEVPGWARAHGHRVVDAWSEGSGGMRRHVVRLERRAGSGPVAGDRTGRPPVVPRSDGELHTADLRTAVPAPATADPSQGFVPLGALAEPGGVDFSWRLSERDEVWADDLGDLTEQASAAQWDASIDIPWEETRGLDPAVDRAVAQVTTFIAQNEYAALYVPARFLDQVNPRFVEVLLWLSSHVHDEARHIEAFTKRALLSDQAGVALAATELSLRTLLDESDFTAAALLLNVLGEGTFLDLLRFVADHAPDAATATAARLAHRDERRHVHFGISHVRRSLARDEDRRRALVAAAESRAAKLTSLSGLSPLLIESLTLMAARSLQPAELSEAAAAVTGLIEAMGENRVRRLRAAGFDDRTARHISELHTPNLM